MIRLKGTGAHASLVAESDGELWIGSAAHCVLRVETLEPEHVRIAPTAESYAAFVQGAETVVSLVRAGVKRPHRHNEPMALEHGDELVMFDRGLHLIVEIEEADDANVVASRRMLEFGGDTSALGLSAARVLDVTELTRAAASIEDMDVLLVAMGEAAFRLVPEATHAAVMLRDTTREGAFISAYATRKGIGPGERIAVSRGVFRRVLRDKAAVLVTDAMMELEPSASLLATQIRSAIAVPLWKGDEIFGVLQVDNRDRGRMMMPADVDVLALYAAGASLALAHVRLIRDLRSAEARLDAENRYLKSSARARRENDPSTPTRILGESEAITRVVDSALQVAPTKASVLIYGETGVGKERVANFVHESSPRRSKMLVAINCAAVPEALMESELFGHVRGAFTGANDNKSGLFEVADGGTLFLDEVGELPLSLQAKLLRVLQEGEVRPVGATTSRRVDVRLIAASNRDLSVEVQEGRFRADLYYRLGVFPLYVPSLRERRGDIPLLARTFLRRYAQEFQRETEGFTPGTLSALQAYAWPGNVRELQSEVQRLVIQTPSGMMVAEEYLSPAVRESGAGVARAKPAKGTLSDMMDSVERVLLTESIEEHEGNKSAAARALGITREGLYKKLKHFGVNA